MAEKLKLSPSSEPMMQNGDYDIEIEASDNLGNIKFHAVHSITVTNRRFSIPPDEVYSVYPPKNSTGDHTACLPHIVFQRNTIPWECKLDQKKLNNSQSLVPGLALMVFSEDEMVREQTMTLEEALCLNKEPGIYLPKEVTLSPDDLESPEDSCTVIDIPKELFLHTLPTAEDAALLAHSRLVELTDKVTDPSTRDGWFSSVTSNRYLKEPKEGGTVRHHAYLVCLSGYEEILAKEDRSHCLPQMDWVRMVVLTGWVFQVGKSPFDFRSIIEKTIPSVFSRDIGTGVEDGKLRQILERGYHPMNHQLREGGRTVSWYRGPLIPVKEESKDCGVSVYADQLIRYDPQIGMLDESMAAAWQLGKMTAIQNMTIAAEIVKWRFENKKETVHIRQKAAIQKELSLHQPLKDQIDEADLIVERCKEALLGMLCRREDT